MARPHIKDNEDGQDQDAKSQSTKRQLLVLESQQLGFIFSASCLEFQRTVLNLFECLDSSGRVTYNVIEFQGIEGFFPPPHLLVGFIYVLKPWQFILFLTAEFQHFVVLTCQFCIMDVLRQEEFGSIQ